MINRRLIWILENRNLLTNLQCGFRKNRSTLDHLVALSTEISKSFRLRQHLIAVFFDLEKAYDTTWRYGILHTLHSWGFKGNLPLFLQKFLSHRTFRIRLGSSLSSLHVLENGVPQGSILSVTLFAIAINSIASVVRPPVKASLFVDDFAIYCSSTSISVIERQLQLVLNKLHDWSISTGFSFSTMKSTCIHFCRKYRLHDDPTLLLGDQPLPFVESAKFLGLYFDRRLTWRSHIKYLQTRSTNSLNLLRVLSATSWGADRICLLRLYRALVRSILDYGSIVYATASPTTLRPLNTIHNAGIRLATGAYRTSRIDSLYTEAGEPSLSIRRDFLLGCYGIKLAGLPKHPTRQVVLYPRRESIHIDRPSLPRSAGARLHDLLRSLSIRLPTPMEIPRTIIPPWTYLRPVVNLNLADLAKGTTCPSHFRMYFKEVQSLYPSHSFIYTDGSARNGSVGFAFYGLGNIHSFKLHPFCSVYTAEIYALLYALKHVEFTSLKKVVICTDSLSAIHSLSSLYSFDPLVLGIQGLLHRLLTRRFDVILCWVPGHVGIAGNERADAAAKAATMKADVDVSSVPIADMKRFLRNQIFDAWQTKWQSCQFKLHAVKDTVKPWRSSSRSVRREEVILTRLRIGHCHFSHNYLFKREPPPICEKCNVVMSVLHILIDCVKYNSLRRKYQLGETLKEVLADNDHALSRLFTFLRESGLYRTI